jgi:hypothetical protein
MIHYDAAQQYSDDLIDQVDDMTVIVKCNALDDSGPGCANHIIEQAEPSAHPVVGHTTYGGENINDNVGWPDCFETYYPSGPSSAITAPWECYYHQTNTMDWDLDLHWEHSPNAVQCSHPLEFGYNDGSPFDKSIHLIQCASMPDYPGDPVDCDWTIKDDDTHANDLLFAELEPNEVWIDGELVGHYEYIVDLQDY